MPVKLNDEHVRGHIFAARKGHGAIRRPNLFPACAGLNLEMGLCQGGIYALGDDMQPQSPRFQLSLRPGVLRRDLSSFTILRVQRHSLLSYNRKAPYQSDVGCEKQNPRP